MHEQGACSRPRWSSHSVSLKVLAAQLGASEQARVLRHLVPSYSQRFTRTDRVSLQETSAARISDLESAVAAAVAENKVRGLLRSLTRTLKHTNLRCCFTGSP